GADIDLEVGDMRWRGPEAPASQIPHLFTYVRYNADLSPAGLESLGLSALRSAEVQRLDAVDRADDLRRIGRAAAAQVSAAHFAGFLGEV
ncbi:MAG: patatin, partial [Verrucomicrobiota bacterium]